MTAFLVPAHYEAQLERMHATDQTLAITPGVVGWEIARPFGANPRRTPPVDV